MSVRKRSPSRSANWTRKFRYSLLPDREAMRVSGARHPAGLLGLYSGVPLEKRTHNYGLVLPDKITVYQRPIELRCRTEAQVKSLIEHVVRHEIAHHFGTDDVRLREIGAY